MFEKGAKKSAGGPTRIEQAKVGWWEWSVRRRLVFASVFVVLLVAVVAVATKTVVLVVRALSERKGGRKGHLCGICRSWVHCDDTSKWHVDVVVLGVR